MVPAGSMAGAKTGKKAAAGVLVSKQANGDAEKPGAKGAAKRGKENTASEVPAKATKKPRTIPSAAAKQDAAPTHAEDIPVLHAAEPVVVTVAPAATTGTKRAAGGSKAASKKTVGGPEVATVLVPQPPAAGPTSRAGKVGKASSKPVDAKPPSKKARGPGTQLEKDTPAASAAFVFTKPEGMKDTPAEDAQPPAKRRAPAVASYKEQVTRGKPSDYVVVKALTEVADEALALEETGGNSTGVRRRLVDFTLVDGSRQLVPVERALLMPGGVSLTGVVYPMEGNLANKEQGRKVADVFGPVKEWRVVYSKTGTTVLVRTAAALYEVQRPAASYRKVHSQLDEQLQLAHQVYLALSPDAGGSLESSYEEVVAKLARTKMGVLYGSLKNALLVNARFLLSQLVAMAGGVDTRSKGIDYRATHFAVGLEAELAKGPYRGPAMVAGGGIRILDPPKEITKQGTGDAAADALADADAEMAARLQAKMDAQAGAARGGRKPMVAPYIRINEEEIADDYPLPKQYEKVLEETDEMLLADPEDLAMGCDPDDLPRRQLTDFAFYNSEGFLSSLELVPMWTGIDHDVEVFGSGVVEEDEGDFTQGDAGAGASGAGGSAAGTDVQDAPANGMRLYLSQIREWVVECSADMLFISIRTDVAWYRLIRPAEQYAAWFSTVLKAAHAAVAVLGLLVEEARASRLSFSDVIRALADLPDTAPGFISKKADRVERFVVVHGQIILNQFKHFPNKAVQRAAFVGELKARMELRKHHKLYQAKKVGKTAGSKVRSVNPMRNRAAVGLKAKPMAATATSMVKHVWRSYFFGGMAARAAQAADVQVVQQAPVAKEVAEDENEEEDEVAVEDALALAPVKAARKSSKAAPKPASQSSVREAPQTKVTWAGASLRTDSAGRTLYSAANAVLPSGTVRFALNDVVLLRDTEQQDDEEPEIHPATGQPMESALGLVSCLYTEGKTKTPMMQVRRLVRGYETMLGDVAGDAEVFVMEECWVRPASDMAGLALVKRMQRPWDWSMRVPHFKADEELRARNDVSLAAGVPIEYFYRALYCPKKGMFCSIPADMLPAAGGFTEDPSAVIALGLLPGGKPGFIKDGVQYSPGDIMYLHPTTFSLETDAKAKGPRAKAAGRKKRAANEEEDGSGEEASEAEASEEETAKAKASTKRPAHNRQQPGRGKTAAVDSDADDAEPAANPVKPPAGKAATKASGSKSKAATSSKGTASAATKDQAKQQAVIVVEAEPAEQEHERPDYLCKAKGRHHKGSNAGLKPFVVVQLLAVSKVDSKEPERLAVRRLYRPEDISLDLAHCSDWWDLYVGPLVEGPQATQVDIESVVGKAATVLTSDGNKKLGDVGNVLDTFCVVGSYNPAKPRETGPPPASMAVSGSTSAKAKKSKRDDSDDEEDVGRVAMASLDIFAGCGGLSEGMHQAGVAEARWAIEYEQSAADAFQLNNPKAKVFANNCNVLLRAAMGKANLLDDCDACEDCMEATAALPAEYVANLPMPGDVEFIMGGPPCQGYSGMNRFNKSNWSLVQNSMVMSYLSYADFYRPRYFLLENVRNFVSHNKSLTFRLTIRTLLEMGYQVRFGVLNAGNFGVPQSRKRTIIWAAAPGEQLPAWPKPRHVFHSPQLTINLPGGVAYTAVPQHPGGGAPLRAVTVKDAIADLPQIENGFSQLEQPYTQAAVSAFQKAIRGTNTVLCDHVCKEMNELNLERCRCIPVGKTGADWRELLEIVAKDPTRELYKGQPLVPWCLPNTMDRHNGWRGLFGRLDLNGHFPTSTTDPQPMGKVGQVFHPTQNRIVSVRECARSQGFPDTFKFSGNVHNKHRQVGNAVPPPLAAALGSQLHVVLEAKRKADVAAAFG